MDKEKERKANKALNVVQYLALARVIDNKDGAKVLINSATETLSELVDEYSKEEGLVPIVEEIDVDLEDDANEDEDPTLELEDLEDDIALGEGEEDEEEVPAEDDDDEDDIVEIDDDDDDEDIVEDEEEEIEEKPSESEAKVTRRALAIANRLHSSGDEELRKVASILAKKISEKKG